MENLLSLAFDHLSSYDGPKIRKGLRQVEGLLANICLSKKQKHKDKAQNTSKDPGKDYDDDEEPPTPPPKTLSELSDDPAFYEFFKLQEGFEWNVALRLVNTLDRLLAKGNDGQNDLLILSALDLIQGVLLLHPPSKTLFSREMYMNVSRHDEAHLSPGYFHRPSTNIGLVTQLLLDLLEPDFCPAIQSATLLTLVVALIDTPSNTRTFENLDGLLTVTSLFKSRSTSRDVKLKLVEFLYFYLMPETPSIPSALARGSVPAMLQRSPSKLAKAFSGEHGIGGRSRSDSESGEIRSQEEKQGLLGRHLSSVDELVKDLRQTTPFGGVVC